MGLYVRLALATGPPFGVFMALTTGALESAGDFLSAAAVYGVFFGVAFALVVGTLHHRGVAKVKARSTVEKSSD